MLVVARYHCQVAVERALSQPREWVVEREVVVLQALYSFVVEEPLHVCLQVWGVAPEVAVVQDLLAHGYYHLAKLF